MFLVLLFLLFCVVFFYKKKSLALLLSLISLLSVAVSFFIGREIEFASFYDILLILYIIFSLFCIIFPWHNFRGIEDISVSNDFKVRKLTSFLIFINSIVFVIFLLTTISVFTLVDNINDFKYSEGVSTEFYYNKLPFNVLFFNFAILAYYFAYFIFPLHFYYLAKKNYSKAIICLILSLNIVLYGLTFFSRAVVVQYLFMYISMLWFLYGIFNDKVKKIIKLSLICIGVVAVLYFINVSFKRFEEDYDAKVAYSSTIPDAAPIRDPVLYSYIDYTGQGILNGYELIKKYDGTGFNGQITFQPILSILGQFKIIDYDSNDFVRYRALVWPSYYSYSFNGYTAYSLYDYGYIGSIIFSFLYLYIVIKLRPKDNVLSLRSLFLIILLIQVPLLAIFYSQMGGIIIALVIWIPINNYLKFKIN